MTPEDCQRCLDQILARLAPADRSATDDLLELRANALAGTGAGRCVRTYYRLSDRISPWVRKELTGLREFLEQQVLVVARAGGRVLRHYPVELAATNALEDFCQALIDRAHSDLPDVPEIELEFTFVRAA